MTPRQAAAALTDLPVTETMASVLAAEAGALAEQIRASLGSSPGGSHDHPWRRTGALQASIDHNADGLAACVGSSDPAAAAQELGTATVPPLPFLAPAAVDAAEPMARALGRAVADLLASRLP